MAEEQSSMLPDWMLFVGKWGNAINGHPLVYHLLDSAAVANLLWQEGLTQGSREQFAHWLQMPPEVCGQLLSFWTSLHDLGKATPTFQVKHPSTKSRLQSSAYDFPDLPKGDILHHSLLSQWILEAFETELNIPPRLFTSFRLAIGGHHGTFHAAEDQEDSQKKTQNLGGPRWQASRRELFLALLHLFDPPALPAIRLNQTEQNAFFNLLTGFFVASDWIASQDELFHYETPSPNLLYYWEGKAKPRAWQALHEAGWIGWQPDGAHSDFINLFGFSPYPLQQTIIQAAEQLQDPFLMIVEAPTGSGKTEAALVAADRAIQSGKLRGCYIAMPTQATSNQMFTRTKEYLHKRYHNQAIINFQLAHGNALLNKDFQELRFSGIDSDNKGGEDEGSVSAMEWFMPRKRTLLAPFGVGTVDQAFISVLRARYSVLRLFGLHRKVVIFDEVHAYDIFMTEIFTRLLSWLRAIGSSVILLSATLPRETGQKLAQSYQKTNVVATDSIPYPRLTINDGKAITFRSLGAYEDSIVWLKKIPYGPQERLDTGGTEGWLDLLRERLSDGGCAAIICNTVDRAQEVYAQIQKAHIVENEDLFLLHARFPFCWRNEKEEEIKKRFGKQTSHTEKPRRGIVVATQIIEQSLDLDFDLMITDLAPIDLLIQRIGRLHRHKNSNYAPIRPDKLKDPLCFICQPGGEFQSSLPIFGNDQYVYDVVILLRTFFTLLPLQSLQLPSASDWLINQVYSSMPLRECNGFQNQEIAEKFKKMKKEEETKTIKARNHLIGDVDWSNSFSQSTYLPDDQEVGETTSTLTRNIVLPSVQLVCLTREHGETFLLDGNMPYKPGKIPPRDLLPNLLRSIVTVSKWDVVKFFFSQPKNDAWQKLPAIRDAYPVVFENDACQLPNGTRLILDQSQGLIIE